MLKILLAHRVLLAARRKIEAVDEKSNGPDSTHCRVNVQSCLCNEAKNDTKLDHFRKESLPLTLVL